MERAVSRTQAVLLLLACFLRAGQADRLSPLLRHSGVTARWAPGRPWIPARSVGVTTPLAPKSVDPTQKGKLKVCSPSPEALHCGAVSVPNLLYMTSASAWFYSMEGMEMDFGWSVMREVGRMPFSVIILCMWIRNVTVWEIL